MQLQIKVESPSKITRKLTITVPASEVAARFEKELVETQKNAKLKGFRPGQAPLSMVKQLYGNDIRHQIFHHLIDESFQTAVKEKEIKAIGRPQIDSSSHQHGEGEHDHGVQEGKDLIYTATVEILPEIEVKNYSGISLKKEPVTIGDKDVDDLVTHLQDSQAQLVPAGSGLVAADGSSSSRPIRKGDFVDVTFKGGLVTDSGVEAKPEMSGNKMVEIGTGSLIPGFEEELEGMRSGEHKTFRIKFPSDYHAEDYKNKEAEFSVSVGEVKEKKLPELDDEFAKNFGAENMADLKVKARESIQRDKESASDRKLRSDLFEHLIEKNQFECPQSLIEAQTRSLAQDMAQELKTQRFTDEMIQKAVMDQIEGLKKRAENQVRSSLILETIAKKEKIDTTAEDVEAEMKLMATEMRMEEEKLRDFYSKNPARKEDLEFRIRQEKTVKFLMDSAKIK